MDACAIDLGDVEDNDELLLPSSPKVKQLIDTTMETVSLLDQPSTVIANDRPLHDTVNFEKELFIDSKIEFETELSSIGNATLSRSDRPLDDTAAAVINRPVISNDELPTTSKLFAGDDKHGSDQLGKAFFDVLAQTIIPQSINGPSMTTSDDPFLSGKVVKSFSDFSITDDSDNDDFYSAWIPSKSTTQKLLAVCSAPPGTYFPEKDDLTMPGVIMTEEMKDPIRDLARQYLGEDVATQRVTLTADSISQDEEGLVKLVNVGCYRAAVNLTTRLLSNHGQGLKKAGHPSKNSKKSLEIWLVRLSLLLKLRLFNMAEAESEPFADLDKPDLYYQFHPDVCGIRQGSMVPFALRTLVSQILSCVGRFGEALDRLYVVLATVTKILDNLKGNLTENGNLDERQESIRQASLTLWKKRELKVLYTITNCLVAQNDFYSAYSLLETIVDKSPENESNIRSAQGHVLLQLGDIKTAQTCFNLAANVRGLSKQQSNEDSLATLIDRALMFIAHNNFAEALNALNEAHTLDGNNPTVINNMAVCLLYMGRLRESCQLLENAITASVIPKPFLHECIIVNVCTLYDLESSRSLQKKSGMLQVVSRHAGDGFNIFCLKLQALT